MDTSLSRRGLLQAAATVGVAGAVPSFSRAVEQTNVNLKKYVQPLPTLETREPDGERNGADSYRIPLTEFTQNLHPDLPDTTLWGYDGVYPGPFIEATRNSRIAVRFDNSQLPEEHVLNVDERVGGTTAENHPGYEQSVPVPEVRTVTHFHGQRVAPESDGQADMWTASNGVEGPRFTDPWQEMPMDQARLTSTYHDHTLGIVRLNAYAGLVGLYSIHSQAETEHDLPTGPYDIPLLIQDKSFNADGSLRYPDEWETMFAGNTAVVNGAVWPYVAVEPRRYRFRIVNGANHRTFSLRLNNQSGSGAPLLHQFAPGHGFLESVVSIGDGGDLNSLVIQPFERGEIIVDFSEYAGETLTLTNNAELPYRGENSGSDLSEILQIQVTDPSTPPVDNSVEPTSLSLPTPPEFNEDAVQKTREMTLGQTSSDSLPLQWTLNGHGFGDNEGIVRPTLGATEIWEISNPTFNSHPIHLHLVTFRVIGRGPDGTEPPDPNERGHKDVVRVEPDETVRIITTFDTYTGRFPWHCHMLEHEDNKMMLHFEVVDSDAPTDPDDDGRYEDVNGDGETTQDDVQTLFDRFDDPEIQDRPDDFDFNQNDRLDYDDVVALSEEIDS